MVRGVHLSVSSYFFISIGPKNMHDPATIFPRFLRKRLNRVVKGFKGFEYFDFIITQHCKRNTTIAPTSAVGH